MGKQRILAVEDDMDVAELLIMFFEGQGYEIFHADTGQRGIALARSRLPNIILLDIMLPDMEGFEVCRQLRSTNLTKYIPTVFLTQRNAHADKVSGLELGADDYITKPFDIEELRARVQHSIMRATRDHLHESITGLPTSTLIDEEFANFSNGSQSWARLDFRLEGYNEFLDAYGFLTANDALNLAARTLSKSVVEHGTQNDFVGVVSAGHFVVFTYAEDAANLSKKAGEAFSERATSLYKFGDPSDKYAVIDAGLPSETRIPIMRFEVESDLMAV